MTDVIVIGSGLAGMSAATALTDAGCKVTVLEAKPYVGGRTASWVEDGMPVETGLHRFLGFYTALPDLLQKVGVSLDDILCWEDEVEIITPSSGEVTLGASPLHKPLKTIWSGLGHNGFLPISDKLALGKMFAAALRTYNSDPLALDAIAVTDYAKRHNISDKALHNILTPLTEGIFFVHPSKYSMYNLVGLIAPYITALHKLRIGAFMGGMSEVMMQPMVDYVTQHGGQVLTNTPVEALLVEDGKVIGVVSDSKAMQAPHTILATSLYAAQKLIKQNFAQHPHFTNMLRLPTMPAVTFQVELNRPSMELDRTTFGPGTMLGSFAEQSRTTFQGSKGRLSIILAQPEKYLDTDPKELVELIQNDASKLGIDLNGSVLDYRKVTLPHDFYSLETGSEPLRPVQPTPIPGLTLAGDYTKQEYLATMEGAVVSGQLAADAVLKN